MSVEIDNCIKNRRSIRRFTEKKIENSLIEEIIRAGTMAPSGGNAQPWHFIVIQNELIIKKIEKIISQKKGAPIQPLFNAKTIISVAVNLFVLQKDNRCKNEIEKFLDSTEIISTGACIENMLLKINDMGLGACWCRIDFDIREKQEEILKIKHPYFLVANIPIGYPAENPTTPVRKKIEDVYTIIN